MADSADILAFVGDQFPSVWTLEIVLLLKSQPDRAWPAEELVRQLRTSTLVVGQSLAALYAAGLVSDEADGAIRYSPASHDLRKIMDRVEDLYKRKPFTVRRMIVQSTHSQLSAFADAFRLKRD